MLKSEHDANIELARGAEALARYRYAETYKPEPRTGRGREILGAVMLGAVLGVLLAIRG
jgi:hypothetical protein